MFLVVLTLCGYILHLEGRLTDIQSGELETSPTTTPIESISVQSSADALNKSLQDKFGRSDVAIAVINSTAIMRCRPDRNFSQANDIKFIWRRSEEPTYLTFNYRRISRDQRYHVLMADFNEFKMDLKIDQVKPSDEGKYICLYRGEKLVHEKHIYLRVLIPTEISDHGSSASTVVVREGLTQKLTCNATGAPAPSIQWFQGISSGADEKTLITTEGNPRFVVSGNALVITNVTRDLRGMYTCVAYNGVEGKVSRVIRLDVYFRPVVVMASPRIQQSLFQTTMITSTVTGNPIYSLYWEFNYKPIRSVSGDCFFTLSGDKYCVTSDRGLSNPMVLKTVLTIYNLTVEDYGTYTCVVHSPFGSERGSTEVIVRFGAEKLFPGSWAASTRKPQRFEYLAPPTTSVAHLHNLEWSLLALVSLVVGMRRVLTAGA